MRGTCTLFVIGLFAFMYLHGQVRELRCAVDGGRMVVVSNYFGLATLRECVN